MFFDLLIPKAYAQAGQQAKEVVQEGSEAGIQELVSFVARNLDNWIAGLIILVITWVAAKLIASSIKKKIINAKGEDIHESVLVLVERVTVATVLAIGATIAAAINGLNFTAVLGALSLGLGFALKDIIGNFISGIIMLSQNRVRLGDLIKVNEIIGTIVSIDTRATVLQAIDGTEVVIPNQSMLNETIISFSTNPFRRIELMVGVDYNTDLPMVTSLIKGIIDQNEDIVPKPEPMVLVDEFGDSSINIKILFWIETGHSWLKIRSNLAHRIKMTFNELGINIPFPIRTLKFDEDDRAFLKTMDSLKKGIVPEPKQVPDKDSIINAASKTKEGGNIPYNLFESHSAPLPLKTEKTDTEEVNKRPESNPKEQVEETPKAPPTHL